ncbi:HEAT repeat domain-containing protein [Streptomyces sp. NBC_01244]|uniref:HEAT repeat domain-containing protein n=1 Tax=Streptomyces sp. NBC_01244 TaxID=2903797 RepID=UPI003FA3BF0D
MTGPATTPNPTSVEPPSRPSSQTVAPRRPSPCSARLAIEDPDDRLRAVAVYNLAAGWHGPETGELLRRIVTSQTDHPISRGAAIRALAGGWRDDPVTEELLRERAVDDSDWSLQRAAVMALAERWPHDPEIQALADRLSDDW